jgi:tellurite resistance protein TehA-like permease
MNKTKLSEMSNEQLLKNEKNLKTITYMLATAVLILFITVIILAFKKGFSALNVVPIALLPIVIVNLNTLKEMKNEIKSRKLSS